jgi:phenylalanyl-tRNA synthetase beta subunit
MKVSISWIKEYFKDENFGAANLRAGVDFVATQLTAKSFEVEEIEEKFASDGKNDSDKNSGEKIVDDFILTVDILPNRAHDCLSHRGIAREIAASTGLKFFDKSYEPNNATESGKFSLEVSSAVCSRYLGCEIENIVVSESHLDLKNKIESIGERSINNIVDITNIVMFETGQPMHAFDIDKLSGNKIVVREAVDGEHITTLDNKEVDLEAGVCMIADEKDVLVIAGIKGGKKGEVDSKTKNILLEAANFNAAAIRKASRKFGIATESSKRFENQITPALAEKAMNMAIDLIKKYASDNKTKIYKNIEHYPKPVADFYSGVSANEVSKLIGKEISDEDIKTSFDKLGFEYEMVKPAEKIVAMSQTLVGKKYKWGVSVSYDSPELFDCSSFTSYLFSRAGIILPRITIDQFVYGTEISKENILSGDLIFSNTGTTEHGIHFETKEFLPGTKIESGVDHVGIYLGDNKIIHATNLNEAGVIIENLDQAERFKNIVGYRRYYNHEENQFAVKIPNERIDLINVAGKFEMKQIDLVEEVGRMLDYSNVESLPIKMEGYKSEIDQEYYLNNLIRVTLMNLGFSEIITYTFVEKGEIMPEKPLSEDKKYLRADLLTGLNLALNNNIKYVDLLNVDRIEVFEIGKVFKKGYAESLRLSIGVKNKAGVKKPKPTELIKNAIAKLGEVLGTDISTYLLSELNDQTESIEINLNDLYQKLGDSFLENILAKNEGTEKTYQKLPEPADIKFKIISTYPFMTRDVAVWIPKDQNVSELVEIIKKHSGDLLANEPRCFDVYEKDGRFSYAYRMVFQAYDKTLTDVEVNEIMEKVYADMKAKSDWEIR